MPHGQSNTQWQVSSPIDFDPALTQLQPDCRNWEAAVHRSERLTRVRELLARHFPHVVLLEDAARVATLERTSFSRFFRRRVGTTFLRWQRLVHLSHAMRLLDSTNRS